MAVTWKPMKLDGVCISWLYKTLLSLLKSSFLWSRQWGEILYADDTVVYTKQLPCFRNYILESWPKKCKLSHNLILEISWNGWLLIYNKIFIDLALLTASKSIDNHWRFTVLPPQWWIKLSDYMTVNKTYYNIELRPKIFIKRGIFRLIFIFGPW